MRIHSINTGLFKLDGGAMYGVVPKTLWQKINMPDENNMCTWAMRCLLIEDGNRLILVDNGGEVKNITQEKFIPNSGYSKGVTFEKRSKGLDNVVVILDKVGDNSIYQTDDFIDNL